jgi:hypothetical protein
VGTHHVTKIVVVGKVKDHVKRFLTVLSYFLRFSEILFDTSPANFEWKIPGKFQEISFNSEPFLIVEAPALSIVSFSLSHFFKKMRIMTSHNRLQGDHFLAVTKKDIVVTLY